jgi:ATP-dependent Lon protease
MFNTDELQSIKRYIFEYHNSLTTTYGQVGILRTLMNLLREKLPNLTPERIICIMDELYPELDLGFITKYTTTIPIARFPLKLPLPPVQPRSSLSDLIRIQSQSTTERSRDLERRSTERDLERSRDLERRSTERDLERRSTERDLERRSTERNARFEKLRQQNADRSAAHEQYSRDKSRTLIHSIQSRIDALHKPSVLAPLNPYRNTHEPPPEYPTNVETQKQEYTTSWMDGFERDCFRNIPQKQQDEIILAYEKMQKSESQSTYPTRLKVLLSQMPETKKLEIFKKLENLMTGLGEGPKYTSWVNALVELPFGKFTELPCDPDNSPDVIKFLTNARSKFDQEVYGHDNVKDEFISVLASWIRTGQSNEHGNVIGVTGAVGVGKTTLVKEGLAKILNRPFYFISLGGSSHGSMLTGHGYTYEGACCGEVCRGLMESGCMDPVFYFDELDKVASGGRGEEIIHTLIHLTDPAQNTEFADRYFAGIPIDVSKALFVFSYNNKESINPILRDRIHEICLEDFKSEEKASIARIHIIPKINESLGLSEDLYQFAPGALEHLAELCNQSTGLRLLKTVLIRLLRFLNVAILTEGQLIINLEEKLFNQKDGSIIITKEILATLFKEHQKGQSSGPPEMMYM